MSDILHVIGSMFLMMTIEATCMYTDFYKPVSFFVFACVHFSIILFRLKYMKETRRWSWKPDVCSQVTLLCILRFYFIFSEHARCLESEITWMDLVCITIEQYKQVQENNSLMTIQTVETSSDIFLFPLVPQFSSSKS